MELLETTAQSHEIEKIIVSSEAFTIIVSPYLKINSRLKPKLSDCFERNNKNLILYRQNELTKDEQSWLDRFSNVTLIPIKNLHAKCYLNEKTALITSMNLYDYSQINNHEIGIKISVDDNSAVMQQLLGFINSIIKTDHPNFDFSEFIESKVERTMGDLYSELVRDYDFPKKHNTSDGVYVFMCDIARKLHKFSSDEIKVDETAIKRTTKLDAKVYFLLKKELIKKGQPK